MQPCDVTTPEGALAVWVIYDHPSDHPDSFVLRPQFTARGGVQVSPLAWTADSIEALRAALPPGLVRMNRHPDDDPVIVEVWM